jgi:TonB-dependent starch-binding outer membrane protein SusC
VLPTPSQGFLESQLENVGQIRNQGFEVKADVDLVRSPGLNWSARAHYARNESEAVDLGGEIAMSDQLQQIREGYPLPSFFGPKLMNPNELADPIYSDEDQFLGSSWPVHNVGVGSTLTLGQRLTLDAQGEFQGGHYVYNSTGYNMALDGVWQPCFNTQRALATGDEAALSNVTARERVRCAISGSVQDQYQWIERADFFKLRVVSVTYEVPGRWLRGVDRATLTLSGRNLFEISDYTGLSVESNEGSGPNVMSRRDHFSIPPYRTFQLSIRAAF